MRPTLLGRIFAAAFKLPTLDIVIGYRDTALVSYRFIPAMGRAGFLLSPTIGNQQEFAAMQSDRWRDLLSSREVVSVGINGESGTRWLWGDRYSIRLTKLQFPPDMSIPALLFDKLPQLIHKFRAAVTAGSRLPITIPHPPDRSPSRESLCS